MTHMASSKIVNLTNLELYKYQASLRELLQQYEAMNDKVKKCLDFHQHNSPVDENASRISSSILSTVKQEIHNIDRFELRLVVVAQMKAGKSTIINALIGDDLLPTRGNAMTTLPTEVVFNRDRDKPRLVLSDEAVKFVKQLQNEMRSCLKAEDIGTLLDNQSHLVTMVHDIIKAEPQPYFQPSKFTVDLSEIQKTLTSINDLVRIFLIVSGKRPDIFPNVSLKSFMDNNMRLEVPVTTLSDKYLKDIQVSMGNLTIVDTPGPNEAGASEELQQIVQQELQKAALVILVLNFTAMGTEADQKIYEDIRSIREANSDPDCIYAIVNKVDQRRGADMKRDAVKKFIATKYSISETTNESGGRRIFEMKGIHCLIFRRFMKELGVLERRKIDFSVKDMTTARSLLKELHPFRSSDEDENEDGGEDEEEEITVDCLRDDAIRMWKYAGLQEFVEGPISDLFKKLAPRSLQSALNVCLRSGSQLRKQINDRQQLLNQSKESLEKECHNVQKDCDEIAELEKKNHQKLQETIGKVRKEIDEVMIKVSDKYRQNPTSVSVKDTQDLKKETQKYHWTNAFGAALIAGGLIAATIISGGSAPLAIAAVVAGTTSGTTIIRNTDDDKKFTSEEEAKTFLDNLDKEIYEFCKLLYDSMRNEIEALCHQANLQLSAHIKTTTSDIVKKANERLQKNFNIELIPLQTLTIESKKTEISVEKVIQRYRPLWGYALFGRKAKISTEENKSKISGIKTQISRVELEKICVQSIQHYMDSFRRGVDDHFNAVLVKTFQSYFEKLNTHVEEYKVQVLDTLQTKTSSKERQDQYSSALKTILAEIESINGNVRSIANELGVDLKNG